MTWILWLHNTAALFDMFESVKIHIKHLRWYVRIVHDAEVFGDAGYISVRRVYNVVTIHPIIFWLPHAVKDNIGRLLVVFVCRQSNLIQNKMTSKWYTSIRFLTRGTKHYVIKIHRMNWTSVWKSLNMSLKMFQSDQKLQYLVIVLSFHDIHMTYCC